MKRRVKVKGQTGQPGTEGMFEKWGMMGGGRGGRAAKLQSRKSGANLAGNARGKVPRSDLTRPDGLGPGSGSTIPRQKLIQKQKRQEVKAKERIKKEKVKEKISGMVKRAKRDKELEGKIGKKGLEEAKKAYKGLYGDWDIGGA